MRLFLKIPFIIFSDLFLFFITYIPGPTGNKLRYLYYKTKLKSIGKNVVIDVGVQINGGHLISIGDNVHIDKFTVISTGLELQGEMQVSLNDYFKYKIGEIHIGNNVHICQFCILMGYGGILIEDKVVLSSGCKIYSLSNVPIDLNDKSKIISLMPYSQALHSLGAVVLRSNIWLGLNTIVMPGVTVHEDSFCSSNSIINTDIRKNAYISTSNKSRIIGDRFKININ